MRFLARTYTLGAAALIIGTASLCGASATARGAALHTPLTQASVHVHSAQFRFLRGPAVSGAIRVPAVPQRTIIRHASSKNKQKILYVADISNSQVLEYDPTVPNPSPEGSITSGVSSPAQVAVDRSGTLYVSNLGNNTITEYPAGQSTPSFTITAGLSGNYGVAVDSQGNVFASNLNNNTITGYHAGQNQVFETIQLPSQQPVGLAEDSKDNLYIAVDTNNIVYQVASGTTTLQNMGLTGLQGPVGVSIGKGNTLYVGNFGGNNVTVYPSGQTTPAYTITNGINGPTLNGTVKGGYFFQSNQSVDVVGYHKKQTTPFSTITGIAGPLGVAGYPLAYK